MRLKIRNSRIIPFVFVFLVATPLSCILSFINTWRATGFDDDFLWRWMENWAIGFMMVYPMALILVRIARYIIGKITELPGK